MNPRPVSFVLRSRIAAVALGLLWALSSPLGAADNKSGRTYTFQVVLLIAETNGPAVTEGVPPGAQKALVNLREFLPYKSYRLLDLGWLRTMRTATATLAGPGGATYRVSLHFVPADGPGERLLIERFSVAEVPTGPEEDVTFHSKDVSVTPRPPRAAPELLSSTFGMELGETVVVGTSKLDGPNKALVVLVSALP